MGVMSQGPAVVSAGTGLTGMETVWNREELFCIPALPSKSLVGFDFGVPRASLQPRAVFHLPAIGTYGCPGPPPCQTHPLGAPSTPGFCTSGTRSSMGWPQQPEIPMPTPGALLPGRCGQLS